MRLACSNVKIKQKNKKTNETTTSQASPFKIQIQKNCVWELAFLTSAPGDFYSQLGKMLS